MKIFEKFFYVGCLGLLTACSVVNENKDFQLEAISLLPDSTSFVDIIDHSSTKLYTIKNEKGLTAAITNYGGRVVSLIVPDKDGNPVDVVLGMDSPHTYANSSEPYFGALIGRVGNRIAKGRFLLNGKEYSLFTNNGPNTLHGGKKGFQDVVWKGNLSNDSTLILRYNSPDGEEGFPGNLAVKVTYTITSRQGLKIEYEAQSDKPTPVNLTNHAFFNLNGEGAGTINNHLLMINADKYTPVDSTLIPLGIFESVENTPFDFRKPTEIGSRVQADDVQLKYGNGYDHNYVLTKDDDVYSHAAQVIGDQSGIKMDVYTEEPGLQFYGGNTMGAINTLTNGKKDEFRTAFCLETQHYPDSPNQPNFPSIILNPGQKYSTSSEYVFSIK